MAIKPTELINRKYDGQKNLIAFDYELEIETETGEFEIIRCQFTRMEMKLWKLLVVIHKPEAYISNVYEFLYSMPKSDMNIEIVAASGLGCFQMQMKEEVQYKSTIDFTIADIIRGM